MNKDKKIACEGICCFECSLMKTCQKDKKEKNAEFAAAWFTRILKK